MAKFKFAAGTQRVGLRYAITPELKMLMKVMKARCHDRIHFTDHEYAPVY